MPEIADAATRRSRTAARRTRSRSARAFASPTGSPVTARSFAHTINRLLNPTMKSRYAADFADIVGAQKVIDGKAETAFGVVARGDTLTIRLKKPVGDFAARRRDLCVVPERPARRPGGCEGAAARAPAPTTSPSTSPGERLVLERNRFYRATAHITSTASSSRPRTLDAAAVLDRVERGELDYACVGPVDYAARSDRASRASTASTSRAFFIVAGREPAHVRPQHEPAAVPQQPEAPAGGQLRRRPQGARCASAGRSPAR